MSVEIWRDPRLEAVLDDQEGLQKKGGRITRILISVEPTPKDDDRYLSVIREMEKCKIPTFYCSKQELPHDFLIVREVNYIVKWNSTTMGRFINSAEYVIDINPDTDELERLDRYWRNAKNNSVDAFQFLFTP